MSSSLVRLPPDSAHSFALWRTALAGTTPPQRSLPSLQAFRPVPFASQQRRVGRGGRRLQQCLATAEDDKKGLDFSSNKRSVCCACCNKCIAGRSCALCRVDVC
jgi:hypothetical protein